MYRLLGFPSQNTMKTLYVFEELKLSYEFKLIDLKHGEQKTEEFKRLTPIGKVPVLQHDDESLFESGAICRYLANVNNSPLYPTDKMQRAKVDQWMDYFSCHLGRWLSVLYYEKVIKKMMKAEPDERVCTEALGFIKQQLGLVDKWLQDKTFFLGGKMSIADLFAFAYVEQADQVDLPLNPWPSVQAWCKKMAALESVKRAKQKVT